MRSWLIRVEVWIAGVSMLALALLLNCISWAQDVPAPVVVTAPEGAAGQVQEAQPGAPVAVGPDGKPIAPGRPGRPGGPGGPPMPGQPAGAPGKPDEKKDQGPKTVSRPDKPPLPPDPRELKVDPNPAGKVTFNFHGQPWADILEWLARISGMSLDWQELPGDYLNLITQREYTVPEARDLINRHLLARGYTLLEHGEVLSVVNISKLNPGMVPRVEPEELAKHMPHEYVKVSFALDWLISEKAVEELKPMLSPNSKITAMKNTNRVEAMDAVVNLREVFDLLQREQSTDDEQRFVREFPLKHTRATEVLEQLKSLLGIESKPAGPQRAMSPDQMQAMQQQAQMMAQMQQQGGQPPGAAAKKDGDVKLVANMRKNSIMANAPPDKMEIIAQAVKVIDVETERAASLMSNINRMQVYRLNSVDPDALVRTLLDVGDMDPETRLEVDTKNKAIIAYASLVDQMTIRQVVERLDGSIRKFEVIQLRRLEAEYVAGTIEFMMSVPTQKDQQQPRYYDFYSYRRGGESEEKTDNFKVDADIERNRLLLWANEVEIKEVTNLLVKMGEIPSEGGRSERVRVLETIAPEDVGPLLDRLRKVWPSLAPNPLQLPAAPPAKSDEEERKPPVTPILKREARNLKPTEAGDYAAVALLQPEQPQVTPPAFADKTAQPAVEEPASKSPRPADQPADPAPNFAASPRTNTVQSPVDVTIGSDGRLVISSQDTQALDVLEELIGQVAPPRRDYRIFKLKHADAFWVKLNLKDFFEEDKDDKNSGNSRYVYYYDGPPNQKDEPRHRLSKRKKLKFIDDPDTNTILVQGADSEQLKTIEELIEVYDRPQQADANAARLTAVFQLKHSRAQVVADAVKDVYRDLLSSNDRALQQNQNPEQKNRQSSANTYIFNEGGGEGEEKERTRVTFKGKLSIGIDEHSNTLLVSSEGEIIMKNVTEMIKALDEAAKPVGSLSVVKLRSTNAEKVRAALSKVLAEQKPAGKKEAPVQQGGQPAAPTAEAAAQQADASRGYAP